MQRNGTRDHCILQHLLNWSREADKGHIVEAPSRASLSKLCDLLPWAKGFLLNELGGNHGTSELAWQTFVRITTCYT